MAHKEKTNVQAIIQGRCTECGSINDNYTVTNFDNSSSKLSYEVECECGAEATIQITSDGVVAGDSVSYEDASWTDGGGDGTEQSEDDQESEEEEDDGRLNRDADKQA